MDQSAGPEDLILDVSYHNDPNVQSFMRIHIHLKSPGREGFSTG